MSTTRRKRVLSAVEAASWGRASDFSESVGLYTEIEEHETTDELEAYNGGSAQMFETFREITKFTPYVYRLPYFKVCLFATILEDIITQLRILDVCNTELRICKTMAELTTLLADKFGVEKKLVTNELDKIDTNNLDCLEYKLNKLQADRHFVVQVLSDTYLNLCNERQFQTLADAVDIIVRNKERLNYLTEEEYRNQMLRRDLKRQLRQQRNHVKSVTYDTNTEIEFLKSQVEDAELNAETRTRYVDGWQRARIEQHLQTIFDEEIKPTQTIEELKRKLEKEQRVHTEIELLTNLNINEVLEKVEHWMGKYEKDIESLELKIQIKKQDYENMRNKRLDLEKTMANHAELIKNWVTFKEECEATRKYREKMTNSAVIIQAWWRALLVRNQLGPYKLARKKRPTPKPEEKSKKKK